MFEPLNSFRLGRLGIIYFPRVSHLDEFAEQVLGFDPRRNNSRFASERPGEDRYFYHELLLVINFSINCMIKTYSIVENSFYLSARGFDILLGSIAFSVTTKSTLKDGEEPNQRFPPTITFRRLFQSGEISVLLLADPRCCRVGDDIEIHLRRFPLERFLFERVERIEHERRGGEIGKNQLRRTGRQLLATHLEWRFIGRNDEFRVIFFQPTGHVFSLLANEYLDVAISVLVSSADERHIAEAGAVIAYHFACAMVVHTRENDVTTLDSVFDGECSLGAIIREKLCDGLHAHI